MGLHTGEPQRHEDGYIGIDVHRAARIMAAGHGGQVLVSQAVHAVVAAMLPDGVELRDLGEHRLKDLGSTEQIFQLVAPDLPDRFPRLATLDRVVNNLPTQITSFLGRREQIADVRALLDDPASRLVTLTGPGGTGKTRLALHAAADQVDRFPDGVFLVDLSPDHDVEAALGRIVRTIGVRRGVDESTLLALKRDIGPRHMLLLLDNCEQIQRLGVAVAEVLGACPRLTVLATSRESLHVRGERGYAVPPLSLPPESASLRRDCWSLRPCGSSSPVRRRAGRISFWTTPTQPTSLRSVAAWTVCRWLSSWRRRGSACSPQPSCGPV